MSLSVLCLTCLPLSCTLASTTFASSMTTLHILSEQLQRCLIIALSDAPLVAKRPSGIERETALYEDPCLMGRRRNAMSPLASIDKFVNSVSCPCRAFGTHGVRSVKSKLARSLSRTTFSCLRKGKHRPCDWCTRDCWLGGSSEHS